MPSSTPPHLATSQKKFRDAIDNAVQETPRFLFQFWHSKSGGTKRLNTVDAITLHALLDADGPQLLHTIRPEKSARLQQNIFHTSRCRHSLLILVPILAHCLRVGNGLGSLDDGPSHLLARHGQALGSEFRSPYRPLWNVCTTVMAPGHLSLAFGLIETPAFRAKKLEELIQTHDTSLALGWARKLNGHPAGLFPGDSDISTRIGSLRRMAGLCGELETVMAAHLMVYAVKNARERKQFLQELAEFTVPKNFATDKNILTPEIVEYHGHTDAIRAAEFL